MPPSEALQNLKVPNDSTFFAIYDLPWRDPHRSHPYPLLLLLFTLAQPLHDIDNKHSCDHRDCLNAPLGTILFSHK